MIDEQATFEKYGYYSTNWKPQSHKKIVAVCDECGAVRYPKKQSYRNLCNPCSNRTDERRRNLSELLKGIPKMPFTDEHRRNISEGAKGRKMPSLSEEHRQKISEANKGREQTYEQRCKTSAAMQGVSLDDWEGFAHEQKYCPAFNGAIKERVREKYGRLCFICGTTEEDNGEKLCVHHTDMNKQQGCNGHEWKLVPLCRSCHSAAHYEPTKARIEYIRYHEDVVYT